MTNDEKLMQNEFNPDWNAMAVMVEEQQRMAKRIEELEKREWQGLTHKDQMHIAIDCGCMDADWLNVVKAVEAKLKERNT